jgi:hypothetical protein
VTSLVVYESCLSFNGKIYFDSCLYYLFLSSLILLDGSERTCVSSDPFSGSCHLCAVENT